MAKQQRDQSIGATRLSAFEMDVLKSVEEKVGGRSKAVQLGILYAGYQQLGAASVAALRRKHKLSFDDMRAMYVDPNDSLSPTRERFLEVDGVVSQD
jgi:hypothetical protein